MVPMPSPEPRFVPAAASSSSITRWSLSYSWVRSRQCSRIAAKVEPTLRLWALSRLQMVGWIQ